MNSSSNIQISQSSLLSLKAEILRKQQEVNKAKLVQQQTHPTQTPLREKVKKPKEQNDPQNKGVQERQARDFVEDEDLLAKSRKALESKALLYNRLVKGPENLTEDEIEMNKFYLVQFDRKEKTKQKDDSDEEYLSDNYEPAANPDEEWVEYTDCLGRTRKCLRKDLEYLKEKDFELSKTLDPEKKRLNKESTKWVQETQNKQQTTANRQMANGTITENNELLSADMRRELLRQEWEKQEEELQNKKDIHYQDILFNEARSHGVGYFSFSTDVEEREKQQKELRRLREETLRKQTFHLEQKARREKQMKARLKAARDRKRIRMGLPPEEEEPEAPVQIEEQPENKEEKLKELKKIEEEKAKEKLRKQQVRPWDIGKEGVSKTHYEYSQEEWVDKKRGERQNEFAPPTSYDSNKKQMEEDKTLYFTTKKPNKFKTNNYEPNPQTFKPTPIIDESVDYHTDEEEIEEETKKRSKRKGTEFAPPATFDYYGPSSSKTSKKSNTKQNLEDSIAAGLRFLREQSEKKEKSAEYIEL